MQQLSFFDRDPLSCAFAVDKDGFRVCTLEGRSVYVSCNKPFCGEPLRCSWEEPDNSKEARERRLAWIKAHKEEE